MKQSKCISKEDLIHKRSWDEDLIFCYLNNVSLFGKKKLFSHSKVIEIENYLTKMGIRWKVKK